MGKNKRPSSKKPYRKADGPTAERRCHQGGLVSESLSSQSTPGSYFKRYRACEECVLDTYLIRNKITPLEHEAGINFRHAYLRAVHHIRTHEDGTTSYIDHEMKALMYVRSEKILRDVYSILTEAQKNLLIDVAGEDHWAGSSKRLLILKRSLNRLVMLWNLS